MAEGATWRYGGPRDDSQGVAAAIDRKDAPQIRILPDGSQIQVTE